MKRDLLRIADLERTEIETILDLAGRLKADLRARRPHPLLAGRTLAMIFEKPSLRTRVTFEVGMVQLGGAAISLSPGDIKLGEREPASDIARNLVGSIVKEDQADLAVLKEYVVLVAKKRAGNDKAWKEFHDAMLAELR